MSKGWTFSRINIENIILKGVRQKRAPFFYNIYKIKKEMRQNIAIQGYPGSFHDEAAARYFTRTGL